MTTQQTQILPNQELKIVEGPSNEAVLRHFKCGFRHTQVRFTTEDGFTFEPKQMHRVRHDDRTSRFLAYALDPEGTVADRKWRFCNIEYNHQNRTGTFTFWE